MNLNLFRIKSLMAKVWDEQKKHYLLVWLVYFGVMAVIFTWCSLMYVQDEMSDGYYAVSSTQDEFWFGSSVIYPFYIMLLLLAVSSRGSDFMFGATDRQGLQANLSLPASTGEKFLVRWFFIVPFTYLLFYMAFLAADLVRLLVCSAVYPDLKIFHILIGEAWDWKLLLLSLAGQSLFILGSTFWKKNGFVKTAAFLVACAGLWVAVTLTLSRVYENPETEVSYPLWAQYMLNWGIPLLVWVVCTALAYWRFGDMQLAYCRVRRSTKVVIGLVAVVWLSSILCVFFLQKNNRVPDAEPCYVQDEVWYPLPDFKHLVLEDSLEVYCAEWVSEVNSKDSTGTGRIHRQSLSGVRLDLNLSVCPASGDSSMDGKKQGILITPELYPYLKTELRHDTLHLFFDYPAREKMRHKGKEYLKAMRLYTNSIQICTGTLLSVQNRMHTVVELSGWKTDSLALEGTSFRLYDCRMDALSIQADSSWVTARYLNGEEENRELNSLILSNTVIGRLHEYQNEPAFWYREDNTSHVGQALLHGTAQGAPVVATRQSGANSDITDAFWKTEFGFSVTPFWKKK